MIKNLADYFEEQQEFYLDKISYNRIEIGVQASKHMLNCIDRIETIFYKGIMPSEVGFRFSSGL